MGGGQCGEREKEERERYDERVPVGREEKHPRTIQTIGERVGDWIQR